MQNEPVKVAAFDIDGTLFRWSFSIEIVERLVKDGLISSETYDPVRALKRQWRCREISYIAYLAAIVNILEGKAMRAVSHRDIAEVARSVVEEHGRNVYVFTRELLLVVKEAGYRTVAISGSMKEAVNIFAEIWGIDDVLATELEYDSNGLYTGNVFSSPVHEKAKALSAFLKRLHTPVDLVIAVGDTISDLTMLRMSDFPIAFNPENALKEHSRTHGLTCVTERKDAITVLSAPGQGSGRRTPRFFSEKSLVNVFPREIGMELKARLRSLGYEHL